MNKEPLPKEFLGWTVIKKDGTYTRNGILIEATEYLDDCGRFCMEIREPYDRELFIAYESIVFNVVDNENGELCYWISPKTLNSNNQKGKNE